MEKKRCLGMGFTVRTSHRGFRHLRNGVQTWRVFPIKTISDDFKVLKNELKSLQWSAQRLSIVLNLGLLVWLFQYSHAQFHSNKPPKLSERRSWWKFFRTSECWGRDLNWQYQFSPGKSLDRVKDSQCQIHSSRFPEPDSLESLESRPLEHP